MQTNSAADDAIVNVRFRYNPREGTDLYLVYNENLLTDRTGQEPQPLLTDSRTILLKYSVTFIR